MFYKILSKLSIKKIYEKFLIRQNSTPNLVWTAKNFKWASERYPSRTALPDLLKVINASLSEIDQALKKRSTAYNGVRSKLSQMEKKSTASLVTRPLNDLVKVR